VPRRAAVLRRGAQWRAVVAPLFVAAALIVDPARAAAHHVTPDEVIQSLTNTGARKTFDITDVERSPEMPRLLIVRVGPGWTHVYPTRRVIAAEEWYQLWRDAVPNGVLGIVDAAERPLVNFDPDGRATLHDPEPAPTAVTPPP
jgi:hypothetical protein